MDFEAFKDYGFQTVLGGLFVMLVYLAKSTKDDLKDNDKKLAQDLFQHKTETNNRIAKVEDSLHQSHLATVRIESKIDRLTDNVQFYKREKHELDNEVAGYRGAMPEILKALTIAEKINDGHEKK